MRLHDREVGQRHPLFLIAGPCVIESWDCLARVADELCAIREETGMLVIFKSSFDKANRTSGASFRGPGIDEGLAMLTRIRSEFGLPVLTDVHEPSQIIPASQAVDVLQTPAFLARQTDFIQAVARAGLPVNIKKGQWMAPADMLHVIEKARAVGNEQVMVCERGTCFGYNRLVVDMTGLPEMGEHAPVVIDCTHAVQRPGGLGTSSGGNRELAPVIARAGVAAGVAGVFAETHPDPDRALSDGPNQIRLEHLCAMVRGLVAIDSQLKG